MNILTAAKEVVGARGISMIDTTVTGAPSGTTGWLSVNYYTLVSVNSVWR